MQAGSRAASGQIVLNKAPREYEIRALGERIRSMGRIRPESPQGTLFHTTLWMEASGVPFRLLGCFRGAEMHGGCALGIIGHRTAGRPYPSLTPYLGVLYPSSLRNTSPKSPTTNRSEARSLSSSGASLTRSLTLHSRRRSSICSRSFGKDLRLNCATLIASH